MSGCLEHIRTQISASIAVKHALLEDAGMLMQIDRLSQTCLQAMRDGGKIIFAGNGGSFADAQHLAAEFVSRFMFDRSPLPSIALGTNNSVMSAIGNDYGYDQVFARELEAVARPRDVFIPITTSGNSHNIIKAIEIARRLELNTICLTGETGGAVNEFCECLRMPSRETARIQECHIMVGHIVCGLVEYLYFQMEGTK